MLWKKCVGEYDSPTHTFDYIYNNYGVNTYPSATNVLWSQIPEIFYSYINSPHFTVDLFPSHDYQLSSIQKFTCKIQTNRNFPELRKWNIRPVFNLFIIMPYLLSMRLPEISSLRFQRHHSHDSNILKYVFNAYTKSFVRAITECPFIVVANVSKKWHSFLKYRL